MGKAKIISGGPAGKYNIELVKDVARITYTIATITARLLLLTKGIDAALLEKIAAEAVLATKRGALDEAINKLILGTIKQEDVSKAQTEFITALTAYDTKSVAWSLLQQEQESKTKQKTLLQKALVKEYR